MSSLACDIFCTKWLTCQHFSLPPSPHPLFLSICDRLFPLSSDLIPYLQMSKQHASMQSKLLGGPGHKYAICEADSLEGLVTAMQYAYTYQIPVLSLVPSMQFAIHKRRNVLLQKLCQPQHLHKGTLLFAFIQVFMWNFHG